MSKHSGLIVRHSLMDRLTHWANAVLWILLFLTGLALLDGEAAPIGVWYPDGVRALLGGGGNLLAVHIVLGFIWGIWLLLSIVLNLKGVRFFLGHVLKIYPGDWAWITRKPFILAIGGKMTRKLGISTEIPPQSYYNIGQRGFAVAAILGCIVLACTGLLMFAGTYGMFSTTVLGWCVTLHFLAAGLVFAGLIIHVYMAALVKEERPGLVSMFTGTVPVEFAKESHGLWYEEVREESGK